MEVTPGQTCQDLLALLRHVKTAMLELADNHDLTPAQIGALFVISEGHTTMGDAANTMHCDASNVTGIIDRLVAQKLVIRAESEADRRAKILKLTDEGQRVINRITDKLPAVVGCQKLSLIDRTALHNAIAKLLA